MGLASTNAPPRSTMVAAAVMGRCVIDVSKPFVLLDDARAQGASPARLYQGPVETIVAQSPAELPSVLEKLRGVRGYVAGYLAYEAGPVLEPRLAGLKSGGKLAWFGVFQGYRELASDEVESLLPPPGGAWAGAPAPGIARRAYDDAMARVKDYIAAGDIYQANLTFPCTVPFAGHPLALYAGLRARAGAGYGGVIWTGKEWLLSLSPELFFALRDGKITARPMKGTAARSANDAAAIETLRTDSKQRAENLMIVDLLRNDLTRVAEAGSVKVPELFSVETYPTVHQMVSTVTAQLREGLGAADILSTIFPCGSITGAPKIRAMEVIAEVEAAPRGVYTGSIGRIDSNGDAAFNVAIRTLHISGGHINAGERSATLGLGSGIVADSRAGEEWDECLAKGRFVSDPRRFDLIETMRFDPEGGIHLLDRHVARIGESARAFGISFDRHNVRNALQGATFRIAAPRRVRLMLSMSGRIAIEIAPLPATPEGPVEVALAPLPVAPDDFRLRHKTSDRDFYDDARRASGAFEVAFTDEEGLLTEGSFSNIFVKGDGVLLTPPLSRGLLPGILRAELLANGSAAEKDLRADDLANGFFVGNALRGMIEARLLLNP